MLWYSFSTTEATIDQNLKTISNDLLLWSGTDDSKSLLDEEETERRRIGTIAIEFWYRWVGERGVLFIIQIIFECTLEADKTWISPQSVPWTRKQYPRTTTLFPYMNGSFGQCPWTEETGLTKDDNIPSQRRSRDDASYSKKIKYERDFADPRNIELFLFQPCANISLVIE